MYTIYTREFDSVNTGGYIYERYSQTKDYSDSNT